MTLPVVASALPGGAAPGNDALFTARVIASALPGGAAPGNDARARAAR